ncbi:MAG: VOC family protein [Parvibaculaceae bacterium]
MITGCDHFGIQVRDIERATAFYEDALGLKRVARWSMSQPYLQRLVGYPGATLEIAMLAIPGSELFLEIAEYRNVKKTPIDPANANPGTAHFCLFCDDLDHLHARLAAKGVAFVSDVQTPVAGPNKGGRIVYMIDPDGVRVELVQSGYRGDGSPRQENPTPAPVGSITTEFDHIGIQVRDVERSAAFYVEKLGFEQVARWSMSKPYVQKIVGYYPDVTLEIAMLTIPGSDVFLEILEYVGVEKTPVDPSLANPGTAHFSVFCDGLDDFHARLVNEGVEFLSDVQRPDGGPNQGGRIVCLKDPDGIRVELAETRNRGDGSPRRLAGAVA